MDLLLLLIMTFGCRLFFPQVVPGTRDLSPWAAQPARALEAPKMARLNQLRRLKQSE
jgi:hypothetical protein